MDYRACSVCSTPISKGKERKCLLCNNRNYCSRKCERRDLKHKHIQPEENSRERIMSRAKEINIPYYHKVFEELIKRSEKKYPVIVTGTSGTLFACMELDQVKHKISPNDYTRGRSSVYSILIEDRDANILMSIMSGG